MLILFNLCVLGLLWIIYKLNIVESFLTKKIKLDCGEEYQYEIKYNEIFPLKRKYTFYNRKLIGPNKIDYLLNYYNINKKNCMEYGIRKYYNPNKTFKITDFNPASLNIQNYKRDLCNKDTQRCAFTNTKYYKTPPCCANNLKEMLFYLDDLLTKNNIEYFIYWGTLLGSIRHKGLIPWDTDIDIHIHKKDKKKLVNLKTKIEEETHYKLRILKYILMLEFSETNKQHIDIYYYEFI